MTWRSVYRSGVLLWIGCCHEAGVILKAGYLSEPYLEG